MPGHASLTAHVVAFCIACSALAQPAAAAGLIPTERFAAEAVEPRPATVIAADAAQAQRAALALALARAGVDPQHAQARLAALTDAEIAELTHRYASAPAGGLWFAPFLIVAVVIGALIGRNERAAVQAEPETDLFGRPRTLATAP